MLCLCLMMCYYEQFCDYSNQTLINFMSLTRKGIERRQLIGKLEQVKLTINPDLARNNLHPSAKKDLEARKSKSKQKTIKMGAQRTSTLRQPQSCKNKNGGLRLDRSKESKQSRESLMKSTHSYYIAQRKEKRSGSAAEKQQRSKSKQLANNSHIIQSTFEMQSLMSTHKKKKSNFSSTIGSKFDLSHFNKSALNQTTTHVETQLDPLSQILIKSEGVLQQYKNKYEALEKQNRKYKKKYQQALKKIRYLENKY